MRWKKGKYGRVLLCRYKEEFVEELKDKIPPDEREWNGEGWWVSDGWLYEAREIAFRHYVTDEE
jgi:hypothetical protein